ncbi:hypothetical protein RD792_000343 [Penstemon davidsonii]|uniref:Germin-like protein n=1 Tax=Penstemon davidsonii TaxID=160366 RepID=A0ABR0DKE0_9LAMI|nr:hypothetical protein RD792_000343 [Penstemon davidsonii]
MWAARAWKHIKPEWLQGHPSDGSPVTRAQQSRNLNGFVTSNPDNNLITRTIKKGDVLVFPMGLVHFQRNVGSGNDVAIATLSSQNPGVITIANTIFGSNPSVSGDILAKAFQVDKSVVDQLQTKF